VLILEPQWWNVWMWFDRPIHNCSCSQIEYRYVLYIQIVCIVIHCYFNTSNVYFLSYFISSFRFEISVVLFFFCLFCPKQAAHLSQVLSDGFGPLQQHSDHMLTSSRCLARLSSGNKRILLGQTVGSYWEATHQSDRVHCCRCSKKSVQTAVFVLWPFCFQCSCTEP
jgi:hypothetical protein